MRPIDVLVIAVSNLTSAERPIVDNLVDSTGTFHRTA